jgi:hypothetical protein
MYMIRKQEYDLETYPFEPNDTSCSILEVFIMTEALRPSISCLTAPAEDHTHVV